MSSCKLFKDVLFSIISASITSGWKVDDLTMALITVPIFWPRTTEGGLPNSFSLVWCSKNVKTLCILTSNEKNDALTRLCKSSFLFSFGDAARNMLLGAILFRGWQNWKSSKSQTDSNVCKLSASNWGNLGKCHDAFASTCSDWQRPQICHTNRVFSSHLIEIDLDTMTTTLSKLRPPRNIYIKFLFCMLGSAKTLLRQRTTYPSKLTCM